MHQRFVVYSARAFEKMHEYQEKMIRGEIPLPQFATKLVATT